MLQVAHRGFSSKAPENSVPAFELAVKKGFYGVECDIHQTKDGSFVVMHDPVLDRMCGVDLEIQDLTREEVRSHPIRAGKQIEDYPNLPIPLLEEYLEVMSQNKEVHPFIEIKDILSAQSLQKLVHLVKKYGLLKQTYFISLHADNLLGLKNTWGVSKSKLQFVYGATSFDRSTPVGEELIAWLIRKQYNLDSRHILIRADVTEALHKAGLQVNVWNVNEEQAAMVLERDMNVDMITTEVGFWDLKEE